MADYKLANGSILTDEDIERECAEYESGEWSGRLENIRVGRPVSKDEPIWDYDTPEEYFAAGAAREGLKYGED